MLEHTRDPKFNMRSVGHIQGVKYILEVLVGFRSPNIHKEQACKGSPNSSKCSICLDWKKLVSLEFFHFFCKKCTKKWFKVVNQFFKMLLMYFFFRKTQAALFAETQPENVKEMIYEVLPARAPDTSFTFDQSINNS